MATAIDDRNMSLEGALVNALKGLLLGDQEKLSEAYFYFKRERDKLLKRHPIERLHGQAMVVGYDTDGVLGSSYTKFASDALRMIHEGGFQGHVIMYRFSRDGNEGTVEYASCPAPAASGDAVGQQSAVVTDAPADPNAETAVFPCLDLRPA